MFRSMGGSLIQSERGTVVHMVKGERFFPSHSFQTACERYISRAVLAGPEASRVTCTRCLNTPFVKNRGY